MMISGSGLGLSVGLTSPLHLHCPSASLSWPAITAGLLVSASVGTSALVILNNLYIGSRPGLHLAQLLLTSSSVYMILTQTPRIQVLVDSIVRRDRGRIHRDTLLAWEKGSAGNRYAYIIIHMYIFVVYIYKITIRKWRVPRNLWLLEIIRGRGGLSDCLRIWIKTASRCGDSLDPSVGGRIRPCCYALIKTHSYFTWCDVVLCGVERPRALMNVHFPR